MAQFCLLSLLDSAEKERKREEQSWGLIFWMTRKSDSRYLSLRPDGPTNSVSPILESDELNPRLSSSASPCSIPLRDSPCTPRPTKARTRAPNLAISASAAAVVERKKERKWDNCSLFVDRADYFGFTPPLSSLHSSHCTVRSSDWRTDTPRYFNLGFQLCLDKFHSPSVHPYLLDDNGCTWDKCNLRRKFGTLN